MKSRIYAAPEVKGLNTIIETLRYNYEKSLFTKLHIVTGKTKTIGNKLRTYRQIKHEYRSEPYLKINLSSNSMKSITYYE